MDLEKSIFCASQPAQWHSCSTKFAVLISHLNEAADTVRTLELLHRKVHKDQQKPNCIHILEHKCIDVVLTFVPDQTLHWYSNNLRSSQHPQSKLIRTTIQMSKDNHYYYYMIQPKIKVLWSLNSSS